MKRFGIVATSLFLVLAGEANAQRLGAAPDVSDSIKNVQPVEVASERLEKKEDVLEENKKPQGNAEAKKDDISNVYIPKTEEESRPTIDGSTRGSTTVYPLMQPQEDGSDQQFILMYMENFAMEQSMGRTPSCSMRFVVLTNLDQKVVQFAVKLVWPSISTTLSFIDIMPNTKTFYDYTLFGEGCYSMDKAPNIIVNRCRVKGSTSQQCASKIKWLRDVK